jgi:SP family galactose:H+ symporter-like MFS transporter
MEVDANSAANPPSQRPVNPAANTPSSATPSKGEVLTGWLIVVLVVVVLAGALFGYDQGVISSALPGITKTFSLSLFMTQVVTSYVTLGALVGSFIGGALGDWIGRKRTMLVAGLLFTCGAAVQWSAPDALILVAGRLIVGFGVGVAAVVAPLYAAELAPATLRGRFISSYQLAITAGIFLAYQVNAHLASGRLSVDTTWRSMLGAAAVPGIAMLVIALVAPESPRWLMLRNRRAEARKVALEVQPNIDVDARLSEIDASLHEDKQTRPWSELFAKQWRRPLLIAVGLAVFQQITGINAIIYYGNQIFAAAGFATEASRSVVTAWAIGGVNVVSTLIAIAFIDQVGRRILLLTGLIGMGASLVVAGIAFQFAAGPQAGATAGPSVAGLVTVAALVVFITSFAFSLGPVVWTVINEVFPAPIRGRGVALATAVNWGSAYIVSQFFLSLVHAIGSSFTFWLFALFCALGWIWIYRAVPETKRRTLEQIQDMWNQDPKSNAQPAA